MILWAAVLVPLWLLSAAGAVIVWGHHRSARRAARAAERAEADARVADLESRLAAKVDGFLKVQGRDADWLERVTKRRMLVHTATGKTFDGVLDECTPDGIVLKAAKLLNGTAEGLPMAGDVFVARDQVLFTQLVD